MPTQTNLVFKAAVVIVVCLLQSPEFRAKVFGASSAAGTGAAGRGTSTVTPRTRRGHRGRPKMEVSR